MSLARAPRVLLHADWSKDASKRWVVRAEHDGRRYRLALPQPATAPALLSALRDEHAWVGLDLPIGLPRAYAERRGLSSFPGFVAGLSDAAWARFQAIAERGSDIALERPFYPRTAGARGEHRRAYLCAALGLTERELYRRCEVEGGRKACALFWTVGGNQVGRGALAGWEEVVRPALRGGVRLWPFDGSVDDLAAADGGVVFETYPGDVYDDVGATLPTVVVVDEHGRTARRRGKRAPASRRASAPTMTRWAAEHRIELAPELADAIARGFGDQADGEDRFDAYVGAAGMVASVLGLRSSAFPDTPEVRQIEGWIFGRRAGRRAG